MISFIKKNIFKEELEDLIKFYSNVNSHPIKKTIHFLVEEFQYKNFFLTKSCTQSLELAIMSLNLPKGSEVILPSYGFVSLANAIVLNGLKCVFVDCDPETMNISTEAIMNALSNNTSAIITINYGGVACDYDKILNICKDNSIYLIEDNAHGIRAKYKGKDLGSFGDISTISFDYLKNVHCNEGGGICINNDNLLNDFYESYYFGTNKKDFLKGIVSNYEWKRIGTNSLLAEQLSVILFSQLKKSNEICYRHLEIWKFYYENLLALENKNLIELPKIPDYAEHNAHIFWIKVKNQSEREKLIHFMALNEIELAFHYVPLHSSSFGKKVGEFRGEDKYTTRDSSRLLRLPIYFSLTDSEQNKIIAEIFKFFRNKI